MSTALAPIAAIVTEHEWDRVTNSADRLGRRTHRPVPITEPTTYRIGHSSNDCPRARTGEVVGLDVPLDSRDAGLPCSVCAVIPDSQPVDPAELEAPPEVGNGDGHGYRVVDVPTSKQLDYLRTLARGTYENANLWLQQIEDWAKVQGRWNRKGVSALIDWVREDLDRRPSEDTAARPKRPNRYAGDCRLCGGHVPEGAGELDKGPGGKWNVSHMPGACHQVKVSSPAPAQIGPDAAPPPPTQRPASGPEVPAGHYAIESSGHNDLAFYRVDRPEDGAYAGRVFVKLIVGGHPDRNVPRAHVAGILSRISAAGPEACARRYGQEIGRCSNCNRSLTDETSRALGIGPECRKRA